MERGQPGGLPVPGAPAPQPWSSRPQHPPLQLLVMYVEGSLHIGQYFALPVCGAPWFSGGVGSWRTKVGAKEEAKWAAPWSPPPSITGAAPCKLFCILSFKLRFYLEKTFYNNKFENHQPSNCDVLCHKISPLSTVDLAFSS